MGVHHDRFRSRLLSMQANVNGTNMIRTAFVENFSLPNVHLSGLHETFSPIYHLLKTKPSEET